MQLEEVFEQTHKMPSVPKVAQELIASFNQSEIDIDSIAKKVAQDPVISAKVLRLANSAHFAPPRPIGSIHDAVMTLGFNTVRTLVIATGITGAFFSTPGLDRQRFWHHSLAVAAYARWLAKQCRQSPDIAFTAGLLHNIGELLIHIVLPDVASKLDKFVAEGSERQPLENTHLGFDYVQVGEELARRWNFPEDIQQAIKYQLQPLAQTKPNPFALILHLAITLADETSAMKPEQRIAQLPTEMLALLNLDPAGLREHLSGELNLFSGLDELLN